ncbi:MAG: hypothetical protein LW822_11225 [Phycisphaeraceae bacterium]|nr:hypothetical protein [Phycisphaeraceae bacterium]
MGRHVFNTKMAQLRADRGLTLDALGALAKVSQATAHRAESEPPDSLRSLTVEQLLVGLHTVKPLSEDDVEVLCRLAGLSSGIVHSIRRRLQEVDERRGQARAIPEQDDEMYRQACHASVDHLTRLISARSAWMILQKLIAGRVTAQSITGTPMHDPRVEMQKTAFRVIVGVVMLILFVAPPSIMMSGGGPFRTSILNLRVGVSAVAIDVTTTRSQDREDNFMIDSLTRIMLDERREDNPLNLSEEEVQALAAHRVRYERRLANGERLPPSLKQSPGNSPLLHAAMMPGGQQLVAMLRTELPEIPEHFDEQGQRDFIAQLVRNLSKEDGLSLIAEQTQRGVVEVMLSNYRAKVASERQQVGRASPPAMPPAAPTVTQAPTPAPTPTPTPSPMPKTETVGVPSSDWAKANPAREPAPAVQESVGRASPPASPGGLFSSDRSDKPGDRPTPIDLSAMIREQLLILLTASALWLALFGMPRSVTKTESTQ